MDDTIAALVIRKRKRNSHNTYIRVGGSGVGLGFEGL